MHTHMDMHMHAMDMCTHIRSHTCKHRQHACSTCTEIGLWTLTCLGANPPQPQPTSADKTTKPRSPFHGCQVPRAPLPPHLASPASRGGSQVLRASLPPPLTSPASGGGSPAVVRPAGPLRVPLPPSALRASCPLHASCFPLSLSQAGGMRSIKSLGQASWDGSAEGWSPLQPEAPCWRPGCQGTVAHQLSGPSGSTQAMQQCCAPQWSSPWQ